MFLSCGQSVGKPQRDRMADARGQTRFAKLPPLRDLTAPLGKSKVAEFLVFDFGNELDDP
jgi:hypothetical protein